ncbi:MAG: hypothetical protein HY758_11725 [Nitrospirae bacterium]|nr:hypothetical protein [Nitrospirota bacterium]
MAGASAVAAGTANFMNPEAAQDIINGLKKFMTEENIRDVNELIGGLKC